jgi:hypothetical protein
MARFLQMLFALSRKARLGRSSSMLEIGRCASGKIAVVQEERFRLITDDGQGLLLTLSHSARATPEDLWAYHRRSAHVRVDYSGEPNMASGVATSVREE